jgi:hypothetical protein
VGMEPGMAGRRAAPARVVSTYQYARTRNRVHRVIIEAGRAFKVENCNLDDVAMLRLQDDVPEGTKCKWCWAGYTEPIPGHSEPEPDPVVPDNAKSIPLVTSTRRLALGALAAALLAGGALGVLLSPDPAQAAPDDQLAGLRQRVDDLVVQVHVLAVDINGHTHLAQGTAAPIVVVVPTTEPSETFGPPIILPTAAPTPSPTATATTSGAAGRRSAAGTTTTRTTIVVVPVPVVQPAAPAPTAAPPAPKPTPTCIHPRVANGLPDRCSWPHAK